MSTAKNESLSKAVSDLRQVLKSSLGDKKEHASAIDQIEQIIASIEGKLNNLDFAAEPVVVESSSTAQFTVV